MDHILLRKSASTTGDGLIEATAAALWTGWINAGLVEPSSYDRDVADFIRGKLRAAKATPLEVAMEAEGWTPRDLIHAMAPHMSSFAGMLRDILRLLECAGAEAGTEQNLRLVYEFDNDDFLDQSLESFRESVTRVESVIVRTAQFSLPDLAISPFGKYRSSVVAERFVGSDRFDEWPYADGIPNPPHTANERVNDLLLRYITVVRQVTEVLTTLGENDRAAAEWLHSRSRAPDPREGVASLASNHWVLFEASAIHRYADAVIDRTLTPSNEELDNLAQWLEGVAGNRSSSIKTNWSRNSSTS